MSEGPDKTTDSTNHAWSVRVRGSGDQEARAYAGKNVFSMRKQASFTDEVLPSAVEYLLGALGGDLVCGFQNQATKKGFSIDAAECVVTGKLGSPLVHLGVIGAQGNPGFETIGATLYVSSEADEEVLREAWQSTLDRSPLVKTLERSVNLSTELQITG